MARASDRDGNAESSKPTGKRTTPIFRNDHKLKALALKKKQIHVVGAPSIKFDGTPTFLDVEGMPDRDFYYLVGLRFERDGEHVERSFWADGLDGERAIWANCLRELKTIGNAQIVSYGAYETRFLRQMKARYILAPEDVEFVDRLIGTSVNLVVRGVVLRCVMAPPGVHRAGRRTQGSAAHHITAAVALRPTLADRIHSDLKH